MRLARELDTAKAWRAKRLSRHTYRVVVKKAWHLAPG